jgi:hypothetical protein
MRKLVSAPSPDDKSGVDNMRNRFTAPFLFLALAFSLSGCIIDPYHHHDHYDGGGYGGGGYDHGPGPGPGGGGYYQH